LRIRAALTLVASFGAAHPGLSAVVAPTGLVAHAEQLCDALEVEEKSHDVEAQENVETEKLAHLL